MIFGLSGERFEVLWAMPPKQFSTQPVLRAYLSMWLGRWTVRVENDVRADWIAPRVLPPTTRRVMRDATPLLCLMLPIPPKFCIVDNVLPLPQLHIMLHPIEIKIIYILTWLNDNVMLRLGGVMHGTQTRYVIVLACFGVIGVLGVVLGSVRLVGISMCFVIYNLFVGFLPLATEEIEEVAGMVYEKSEPDL